MKLLGKELTFNNNKVYHAGDKPTPSDIGAAAASHGTHVTWATTAPKANGTAAVGTVARVAREDHVHPLQTTVSGNAGTATKLQTARTITLKGNANGNVSFDGSGNVTISTHPRIFSGAGTSGTSGYVAFAQIVVTANYVNRPIEFKIISRGRATACTINIAFANTNNTDPGLSSLRYWGSDYGVFAHKTATSTWLLYCTKSEAYDEITLVGHDYASQGVTVTYPGSFITTKPTTNVTNASIGGNFGHANTANSATKSTQDSAGQQINTTYIKGLSVSGKTITYTKGDGTTGTITTQDTNTTYSTGTASALGLTKLYTGTGTATDGTMTQAAIKTALDGKAASSHTHSYLPLSGGTLTGNVTVSDAKKISLSNKDGHTNAAIGVESSTGDVYISNINNNWFRIKGDKTMTIGGSKVYTALDKPTPAEIGAAAASHTHSYLPLSGGTMTGNVSLNNNVNIVGKTGADIADSTGATVAAGATGTLIAYNTSHNFHLGAIMTDKKLTVGNTYLNAANNMYLRNVTSDGGIYLQVGGATRLSVNSTATTVSKLVANQGITTGGSIISDTALTDNLGSSSIPFNIGYTKQLNLVGEASKGYGYLSAYTVGTTSTNGESRLVLGNSTASGTASNASGSLFLFGTNTGYTRIVPSNNTTSNVTINLPNGNGSVPLMNKADTNYWGIVNPDGSSSSWVRTTSSGIIPFDQSAVSALGTSSWPFKNAYINEIFENGTSLKNKYLTKSGGTMTGDLTIKKTDGSASKIKVFRTISSKEMEASLDVYNGNGGSASLSTWDRTGSVQTSSYVFGGDALWCPSLTGVTTRPSLGTSGYRFEKAWLNKLDAKDAIFTSGTFTAQGKSTLGLTAVTGQLSVARTTDYSQMAIFQTTGDGNNSGDGNTHIGYFQESLGGYTHYFRGGGPMIVDNKNSLQVNPDWMKLGGKKVSVRTSAPSGPATGDVWIQI